MTRGKMITVSQKKTFLELLKEFHGDTSAACKASGISTLTINDLVDKYPDRDPSFTTCYNAIIKMNDRLIKEKSTAGLIRRIDNDDTIAIIFAQKAYANRNENGKIEMKKPGEDGNLNFDISILQPDTLALIKRDYKKAKGMDLSDVQQAEEVSSEDLEYRGEKIVGGLTNYDPKQDQGQKRRSRLPDGSKRTR